MKERIVITNKEDINFIETYQNVDYTKEQVPETFEELKELCKDIKEKLIKGIWEIKIEEEFIYVRRKWETKEICFTSVGNMVSNNGWDLLMTNLTPARQWQIIKSFIGEK